MSTILKALRRLEDDRAVNEQRPLRETVTAGVSSNSPGPSRGRAGWIVALVVLLAAGGGAGYLAFRSAVDPDAPQIAAAPAPAPAEPTVERVSVRPAPIRPPVNDTVIVPPAEPYEPRAETVRELPDAAFASRVERLDRPLPGPRIDDTPPPALEPEPSEELVTGQGAPITTRLVRGQPLVPPSQLPGRQPLEPRSDIVTRVEPGAPLPLPTAEPPRSESEARAPRTAPAPSATPEPVVARSPGPTPLPPTPPTRQPVARAPEPTVEPQATPPVVAAADPRPSRAEVTPAAAESKPEVASAQEPAAKATPAPSPKPAAKPTSETAVARAAVPDVLVEGTSWHPTATRRTATVQIAQGEMVEVHEGDAVGPLVVARIEPSSVVFTHDGVEIRRRIGQR
jgi:hypothetical protein